jgi:hypothetical protein
MIFGISDVGTFVSQRYTQSPFANCKQFRDKSDTMGTTEDSLDVFFAAVSLAGDTYPTRNLFKVAVRIFRGIEERAATWLRIIFHILHFIMEQEIPRLSHCDFTGNAVGVGIQGGGGKRRSWTSQVSNCQILSWQILKTQS